VIVEWAWVESGVGAQVAMAMEIASAEVQGICSRTPIDLLFQLLWHSNDFEFGSLFNSALLVDASNRFKNSLVWSVVCLGEKQFLWSHVVWCRLSRNSRFCDSWFPFDV